LGAARQALAVDARRVRKDVRGSVNPMRYLNVGPVLYTYYCNDDLVVHVVAA
jgi:hypothetical protein